jgi:hypothetical protein
MFGYNNKFVYLEKQNEGEVGALDLQVSMELARGYLKGYFDMAEDM